MKEKVKRKMSLKEKERARFMGRGFSVFVMVAAVLTAGGYYSQTARELVLGKQDMGKKEAVEEIVQSAGDQVKVLAENSIADKAAPEGTTSGAGPLSTYDRNAITVECVKCLSKNSLTFHSIESLHIDTDAVTSRTISDRSIRSRDLDKKLSIRELFVDSELGVSNYLRVGSGRPSNFSLGRGDLFVADDLEVKGMIYGTFSGVFSHSGSIDMAGSVIENIGQVGTDFTASGGLKLAGDLNVNDKLYINSTSGYVGIGTTGPVSPLHIDNSISSSYDGSVVTNELLYIHNSQTSVPDAAASLRFQVTGDAGNVGGGMISLVRTGIGSGAFAFSTRNNSVYSEKLRIASNGNVGIGTTSPAYLFQVQSSVFTTKYLANITGRVAEDDGAALYLDPQIIVNAGQKTHMHGLTVKPEIRNNISGIDVLNFSSIYVPAATTGAVGVAMNVYGLYVDAPTAGTNNYGAYINGNVGIGTTNPTARLHINPTAAAALLIDPYGTGTGNTGELRFAELAANGNNYTGFKAPDSIETDAIWTLPNTLGSNDQFLTSDGAGNLRWASTSADRGVTTFFSQAPIISSPQTAQTWTNMPAASEVNPTELFANVFNRVKFNLSNFTRFRLMANQSVAGAANARFRVQYSLDGTNFFDLENGTGAYLDVGSGTGIKTGSWADIKAGAKADVTLRVVGWGGNGSTDPAWRQLEIQFLGYAGSQWTTVGSSISYPDSVVIGTNTPAAKLAVRSAGSAEETAFTVINNNSSSLLSVLDNGNTGIGLAAPSSLLHLFGGHLTLGPLNTSTGAEIRFREGSTNGTEYISFKAPNSIGTSVTFTLPSADGTAGQILQTNGSGTLSWTANSAAGMANPLTTTGDLIYASNTSNPATPARLAIGSNGQCLVVSGGLPTWGACAGGGGVAGADTQIQFNSGGVLAGSADFTWDNATKTLAGLGSIAGTKISLALRNTHTGIASSNELRLGNDSAADALTLTINSGSYTGASNYAYLFNRTNAPLIFGTNNTERLRILSGGNVGIGTTNPEAKLQITAATASTKGLLVYSSDGDTTSYLQEWKDASGNNSYVTASGQFVINNGNVAGTGLSLKRTLAVDTGDVNTAGVIISGQTDQLADLLQWKSGAATLGVISGAGRLGIGTSSPGAILDVQSPTIAGQYLAAQIVNNRDEAGNNGLLVNTLRTSSDSYSLDVQSGGISRLYVRSDGNVGIGTTNPAKTLDIVGSFQVKLSNPSASMIGYFGVSDRSLQIYGYPADWAGSGGAYMQKVMMSYASGTDTSYEIFAEDHIRFNTDDWNDSTKERMRITTEGNVGIGTTAPNYKLDVNGSINAVGNLSVSGTINAGEIRINGNLLSIGTGSNWNVSGSDIYRLSGNVGIGTTSPTQKLHIVSTSSGEGLKLTGNQGYDYLEIKDGGGSDDGIFELKQLGQTKVQFQTGGSGISYINTGNVGIGTTNPTTKLFVVGNGMSFHDIDGDQLIKFVNDDTSDNYVYNDYYWGSTRTGFFRWTDTYLELAAVSATSIRLSNTNVGIDVTNPDRRLTVAAPDASTNQLRLRSFRSAIVSGNIIGGIDFMSNDTSLTSPGIVTAGILAKAEAAHDIDQLKTGLSFDVTNGLNYYTAMQITGNGNVGIGTTAPNYALEVNGAINATEIRVNGTVLSAGTGSNWTASGSDIYRLSGNVGIGTTSPQGLLDIVGTGNFRQIFAGGSGYSLHQYGNADSVDNEPRLTQLRSRGTFDVPASLQSGDRIGRLRWEGYGAGGYQNGADIAVFVDGEVGTAGDTTDMPARIVFLTSPDGTQAPLERLTIKNDGNIGIGTASPANTLSVEGNADFTGNVGLGTTNPTNRLSVEGNADFTGNLILTNGFGLKWNNSDYAKITGDASGQYLAFHTGADGLEKLRIDSNGYLGIGTAAPSAKLSVMGTVHITDAAAQDRLTFLADNPQNGTASIYNYRSEDASYQSLQLGSNIAGQGLLIDSSGNIGIGTTATTAQLHTTGTVRFAGLGAGTLQTDADGNISVSSDERLKNIDGQFHRGLADLMNVNPIIYHWNKQSGLEMEHAYVGFSAQNIQQFIPEAVGIDTRGYLTLSDRPIVAAMVNSIKEQQGEIEEQQSLNSNQTLLISQLNNYNLSTGEKIYLIGSTLEKVQQEIEHQEELTGDLEENIEILTVTLDSINQLAISINKQFLDHEQRIQDLEKIVDAGLPQSSPALQGAIKELAENIGYVDNGGEPLFTIDGDVKVAGIATDSDNSGTAIIEAGKTENLIKTFSASDKVKIYLTIKGRAYGRQLYYDDIKEKESFTVKIDGEPIETDLHFNWLIVK